MTAKELHALADNWHRNALCDASTLGSMVTNPAARAERIDAMFNISEHLRRAAQGIEAGTAMTEGHGPKDESPVGEADAPTPNQ